MIIEFEGKEPKIDGSAFLAASATLIGNVTISECASIWYQSVIRADVNHVRIGKYTNYQDFCMIHVTDKFPAEIGDYVTVGHRALIHACKIGNNCLIGMGSIVMDGAVIGDNCIIGAGALVTQGTNIPPGSLVLGAPGKVKRHLEENEIEGIRESATRYYKYALRHKALIV